MPLTLVLPDGYGYCVAIALGAIPLLSWVQGSIVAARRKPANVLYPNAYATPEQAKANPKAHEFNCAQRAHANLLENMSQTIAYILFAGLFYPQTTTGAAIVWILSRAVYAYGYIKSSKPNGAGRLYGTTFWLAQGTLWGLSVYAALTKLF